MSGFVDFLLKVCVLKWKRDKILEKLFQFGMVVGWGLIRVIRFGEFVGFLFVKLRQVIVFIVLDKECKEVIIYLFDKEIMLCVGFKKKLKDFCFGDVGSFFVMQYLCFGYWIVIGLFGWSEGCGRLRKYVYYMRVLKYRKWINFIVKSC